MARYVTILIALALFAANSLAQPDAPAPENPWQRECVGPVEYCGEPEAPVAVPGTAPPFTSPPDLYSDRPSIYPPDAFAQCIEGYVVLSLTVDREGRVLQVELVESEPGEVFDAHVMNEAKSWIIPAESLPPENETTTFRSRIELFMEDYSHCV